MSYAIFLYDAVLKCSDPICVINDDIYEDVHVQFEHAKVYYKNLSRSQPEWKSYVIYQFDNNGHATNDVWVYNQGN